MFFEIEGNVSQQPMRLSDLAVKMLKLHHGNTGLTKIKAVQFIMIDRNTPYILPAGVLDYLPEDPMARFIVDMVEQLDLRALSAIYEDKGFVE